MTEGGVIVPPVIGIVAASANAGKTTLIEKLIKIFKREGLRVGVLKHTHHEVAFDRPGKDTWRHAQAGADVVGLASSGGLVIQEKVPEEVPLETLVSRMGDLDLVIVEGYKQAKIPKIEVFQQGVQERIVSPPEELLAIAGNEPVEYHGTPWYSWDDAEGLARLVLGKIVRGG